MMTWFYDPRSLTADPVHSKICTYGMTHRNCGVIPLIENVLKRSLQVSKKARVIPTLLLASDRHTIKELAIYTLYIQSHSIFTFFGQLVTYPTTHMALRLMNLFSGNCWDFITTQLHPDFITALKQACNYNHVEHMNGICITRSYAQAHTSHA